MNITQLAQESIQFLKQEYGLPDSGFVAGGSIANLIWQKVSGVKAEINDIDIYIFDKSIQADDQEIKAKQHYIFKEKYLYDDYSGFIQHYRTKEFYTIDRVERDGIFNNIYYESSDKCPQTILKSFDINCCQIGFDISTNQFYWTDNFEDFLKTGKLQLTNLTSPSHTAIRLVKKKYDLKATLDDVDFDMIDYCLNFKRFIDVSKTRFKDRYADMYRKYQSDLESRYKLEQDEDLQNWLSDRKGIHDNIWRLESLNTHQKFQNDLNIGHMSRSIDFIFYVRNILGTKYEKIWFEISHLFDLENRLDQYLDIDISTRDLDFLHNLIESSPESVNRLKGLSLSKQLSFVKSLLKRYSKDPLVAISLLETYSVEEIEKQDEFGLLLLELSVRKKVIDDRRGQVAKLLKGFTLEDLIV